MTLPDQAVLQVGTELIFGVSGTFNPADDGTRMSLGSSVTDTITLAGVADGAGRQSNKADLGASRAPFYAVLAAVDYTGETPTASTQVEYYWLPSTSSTDGEGNVAGNSGVDADAPDGQVPSGMSLSEFKLLGIFIGVLPITDDASVQCGFVGVFSPPTRYGQLLVVNEGGDAFENDDVENHVVLQPIPEYVID